MIIKNIYYKNIQKNMTENKTPEAIFEEEEKRVNYFIIFII